MFFTEDEDKFDYEKVETSTITYCCALGLGKGEPSICCSLVR